MKKILLSLGTIATVAAPAVAVVSCGGHDELPGEKSIAKRRLDGDIFTQSEIQAFESRVDAASSIEEVAKIRHEIDDEIKSRSEKAELLKTPKDNGVSELKGPGFENLSKDQLNGYIIQINNAPSENEIQDILNSAIAKDKANELKANLKVWELRDEGELNKDFFLLNDWNDGTKAMKLASSKAELSSALDALKEKMNHPSISFATKDGWIIDAEEAKSGVKLYIPNNSKGTKVTWTDVSSTNHQKTVVYEVTGVDASSHPIIDVTIDGVLQQDKAIVDGVNVDDCGMVLTDFSGSYHVSGVKELDKFERNKDIIQFLLNSKPVMKSTSAELKDIKGMETILQSLSTTSSTYKNIDVVDGKISLW